MARNVTEILQLHELFVEELRSEMAPLGFHINLHECGFGKEPHVEGTSTSTGNIDAAICAAATKITMEASSTCISQTIPIVC